MTAATRWGPVLLLCAGGVLAGGQFAKVSVEFTRLQALYGVAPARMGLALSTVGLVGLLFGVLAGGLAPRIGFRRLLLAGLAGGAALSALQALVPPFGWFWASRVPEGLSHLAIMVATPALLLHASAPAHRAVVMGLWTTVVGLSFAVLAGVDRLLPAGLAPRDALAGHALLMAAAAVAVRLCVADAPAAPGARRPGLLALHAQAYADLRTALPGLGFFFYAFPTIALITFVPPASGAGAGFATVLPLLATAGTLAAGWLARQGSAGTRLALRAYAALALSALALALAARLAGPVAPLAPLALLVLACAGLAGGASATLIPQLHADPAGQARASGVLVQLGNLGSVTGPPLFAALAVPHGLAGLALLTALAALGAVGLMAAAGRRLERS
ncbi:MFS transporter [Roseateles sp. DXS20W]|uniref:MFS transporter n=1 Tax=Pelomonas lactea TaxID=3299030 RepID=A0ABW7GSA3_9BURK